MAAVSTSEGPPAKHGPAVLWFRRDLRLADHPALLAARDAGGEHGVVAVFSLDRRLWEGAGQARRFFLAGALADLAERLDGRLSVVTGAPERSVVGAAVHLGAGSVHVSEEFTPYGRARDAAVAEALAAKGVPLVATGSPYAVSPGRVRKDDGTPYRVFTPFSKAWRSHGWHAPAATPRHVDWLAYDGPHTTELPRAEAPEGVALPEPTESAAHRRWHAFRDDDLDDYADRRNDPGADATSRLSAYLHFGLLHPRTLLADLGERGGTGVETFRTELCWREFYADTLFSAPKTAWRDYDERFAAFGWDTDAAARKHFTRWQEGRTGYPIVDAGMRQLLAEGWMHNRVRMIVASFLVKDLHIPWQWGARHFLNHLVDGDVASNNFGWQWTAGTGTDAAPYFRVFNPVLQGERYDPRGDYVRRFVPELADLAGKDAHTPWDAEGGVPDGYPERMVDHKVERAEALRRYEAVKNA